ncbi:MAG TPA: helix-turn-helix domain-containing protein [Pilimelia sp.]|nr:helix-turn-helix domain-containing protein [Pilimelia sp.]
MLRTVAVVVVDGVAPFEFGVACEVFGLDRSDDGVPRFDFRVCGPRAGVPLRSNVGVAFTPTHGLEGLTGADLVVAAAADVDTPYSPDVLDAVRAAVGRGATALSLCSGAFLLGAAGLLDGRRCTTHWRHAAALQRRYPDARVDPDVLYVDDGPVTTSAGTAAGIDACLHLVRRELGGGVATAIARRMVVPPQRDGGQRQFIDAPLPACEADSLQPLLAWLVENLDRDHSVAALAQRARLSTRTFARRFQTETGTTPQRWLTTQRVLAARTLLEESALGVDDVARRCGFGSAALLRHHFRRAVGVAPHDYRRTFAHQPRR